MTTQTLATAEIENWFRIRVWFLPNFWLRLRKKNAESCRSRLRHSGSGATSARQPTKNSFFLFGNMALLPAENSRFSFRKHGPPARGKFPFFIRKHGPPARQAGGAGPPISVIHFVLSESELELDFMQSNAAG